MTTPRSDSSVSRRTALAGLAAGGLGLAMAVRGAAAQDATPAEGDGLGPTIDHHAVGDDDAEAIWFVGTLALIKGVGSRTGNVLSTVEFTHPPGFATALHVHHTADEAFYVLAGEMEGVCGDETWRAEAGAFVWLPRGVPHGYVAVGEETLRTLALTVPAGFDRFVVEAGEPAQARTLPPATPPDIAKVEAVGARYGIETLGPPVQPIGTPTA